MKPTNLSLRKKRSRKKVNVKTVRHTLFKCEKEIRTMECRKGLPEMYRNKIAYMLMHMSLIKCHKELKEWSMPSYGEFCACKRREDDK